MAQSETLWQGCIPDYCLSSEARQFSRLKAPLFNQTPQKILDAPLRIRRLPFMSDFDYNDGERARRIRWARPGTGVVNRHPGLTFAKGRQNWRRLTSNSKTRNRTGLRSGPARAPAAQHGQNIVIRMPYSQDSAMVGALRMEQRFDFPARLVSPSRYIGRRPTPLDSNPRNRGSER